MDLTANIDLTYVMTVSSAMLGHVTVLCNDQKHLCDSGPFFILPPGMTYSGNLAIDTLDNSSRFRKGFLLNG
jgi:hypothetical protein